MLATYCSSFGYSHTPLLLGCHILSGVYWDWILIVSLIARNEDQVLSYKIHDTFEVCTLVFKQGGIFLQRDYFCRLSRFRKIGGVQGSHKIYPESPIQRPRNPFLAYWEPALGIRAE